MGFFGVHLGDGFDRPNGARRDGRHLLGLQLQYTAHLQREYCDQGAGRCDGVVRSARDTDQQTAAQDQVKVCRDQFLKTILNQFLNYF